MVVGPQPMRLALERRLVAVGHRPERLMAAPAPGRPAEERIIESIDRIAA
jgi:hypothetical protein